MPFLWRSHEYFSRRQYIVPIQLHLEKHLLRHLQTPRFFWHCRSFRQSLYAKHTVLLPAFIKAKVRLSFFSAIVYSRTPPLSPVVGEKDLEQMNVESPQLVRRWNSHQGIVRWLVFPGSADVCLEYFITVGLFPIKEEISK